jgi:hypothetical protein
VPNRSCALIDWFPALRTEDDDSTVQRVPALFIAGSGGQTAARGGQIGRRARGVPTRGGSQPLIAAGSGATARWERLTDRPQRRVSESSRRRGAGGSSGDASPDQAGSASRRALAAPSRVPLTSAGAIHRLCQSCRPVTPAVAEAE